MYIVISENSYGIGTTVKSAIKDFESRCLEVFNEENHKVYEGTRIYVKRNSYYEQEGEQ
jgi:hypothetical protein